MRDHRRAPRRRSPGFTLVELLTILVIISVLVGIALPTILQAKAQAVRQAALTLVRQIHTAVEMYRDDNKDTLPLLGDAKAPPSWEGKQWLVQCLTGYRPANVDGVDGYGFRTTHRGPKKGPYNSAERIRTVKKSWNDGPLRPVFVDPYDNEVFYAACEVSDEGKNNWIASGGGPENLDSYVTGADGVVMVRDFFVATVGPDGHWGSGSKYTHDDGADRRDYYKEDPAIDDVTDFFEE